MSDDANMRVNMPDHAHEACPAESDAHTHTPHMTSSTADRATARKTSGRKSSRLHPMNALNKRLKDATSLRCGRGIMQHLEVYHVRPQLRLIGTEAIHRASLDGKKTWMPEHTVKAMFSLQAHRAIAVVGMAEQ